MTVNDGEILVYGDLHFSDVYTGKHKNYLQNCTKCLRQILDMVEERKPKAVIFLGDIVGWHDTNVRNREVLKLFVQFLQDIKKVAERVLFVRGNHDMQGYPDYQFLIDIGVAETVKFFDYYANGRHEVRFHLVDYGTENEALDLAPEVSNVVLAHNNFTIAGVTDWYADCNGIELNTLQSFIGVDLVVAGHIHNPSPELVSVDMADGHPCGLFYVGCPTRPVKIKDNYNACWAMSFSHNGSETDFDPILMDLEPAENIYIEETSTEELDENSLEEQERKQTLMEVLDDIMQYRITSGDVFSQVDKIPNATDEAKRVAKEYLQVTYNTNK